MGLNSMDPTPEHSPGFYAWVVVFASFFGHMLEYGVAWTVGVFHQIFMEQFEGNSAAIALISSLQTATFYGIGSLASVLINRYGCRRVTIFGGLLGNLGLFVSVFATNIYHLQVTFGVLAGIGYGIAYLPTVTIVGHYFVKLRTIAFGLAVSGVGVGTFLWPVLIRLFEEQYGWRGAMMLVSGVGLNICVCGALFRPKHTRSESAPKTSTSVFNCAVFNNSSFLVLCANQLLFSFGVSVVYIHLSHYAATEGLKRSHSAYLISLLGVFNLLGRFTVGFIASHPRVKALPMYTLCFFLCGLLTVVCGLYSPALFLMIYAALFGLLSAAWGVLTPEIIIQLLGRNLLSSAYGYLLVPMAVGSLLGAPVAGWVYDQTQNYPTSFYMAGVCCMVAGLLNVLPWRWNSKQLAPPADADLDETVQVESTSV